MTTDHLSIDQIERFALRVLPAPDLSVIAEHLNVCPSCLRSFREVHQRNKEDAPFAFTLAPEIWFKNEHLEYEQLAAYLDSVLEVEEREIAEVHLRACERCQDSVQSLREFRRQIAPEMSVSYAPVIKAKERDAHPPVLGWLRWQWTPAYVAAVIVIAACIGVLALFIGYDKTKINQQANLRVPVNNSNAANARNELNANLQLGGSVDASANTQIAQPSNNSEDRVATVRDTPRSAAPPAPRFKSPKRTVTTNMANAFIANTLPPAIKLHDGETVLSINEAGNVVGLRDIAPANAEVVKEVLLSQNITKPTDLAPVISERGTLRGGPAGEQSFKLLSPAQTVIANVRPILKWEAMPGATNYRVYVGDASNHEVARSGELASSVTAWTPQVSLPRGKVYSWSVIATVNGNEVTAPAASAPEMKFKVLSNESFQELMSIQSGTRSHLVLGIFYTRAGMLDEAEREFRLLVEQNPRSPLALKLLHSVQSWR